MSNFGTDYDYISCSKDAANSTDPTIKDAYDAYCLPVGGNYGDDYLAGARKKCADEGMHLPTLSEWQTFYAAYHNQDGFPTTGEYVTSSVGGNRAYALMFDVSDNTYKELLRARKKSVICFE